jgi:hypothetical protein
MRVPPTVRPSRPHRRTRRASAVVLALLLALALAACGGDASDRTADQEAAATVPDGPYAVTLEETERELRDAGLELRREGPPESAEDLLPSPVEAVRYRTDGDSRIDVLVYPTHDNAMRARDAFAAGASITELNRTALGGNILAIVDERGADWHRFLRTIGRLGEQDAF